MVSWICGGVALKHFRQHRRIIRWSSRPLPAPPPVPRTRVDSFFSCAFRRQDAGRASVRPCILSITHKKPGHGSNGEDRQERDGCTLSKVASPWTKRPFAGRTGSELAVVGLVRQPYHISSQTPYPTHSLKPDMSLLRIAAKCHAPLIYKPSRVGTPVTVPASGQLRQTEANLPTRRWSIGSAET